ncbi:MAG TPA: GNAT family N-acetyltransferase [Kofleriaceae bacterium]|nr:GNAT family N-acetyltransferase [Kofleriaceae bacterium]
MSDALAIGLVGDRDPAVLAHRAIPEAIRLAAAELGVTAEPIWLATEQLPADPAAARAALSGFDAIWCAPASPYRHTDGALAAIRAARTGDIPFFGSCGGFQHALLEIARSVLAVPAAHAELDPDAVDPVVAPLTCSLVEERGEVILAPGSLLARAYRAERAVEGYHCRYGLHPAWEARLAAAGVTVTARDGDGDARGFELAGPRFFTGTLFQPERRALVGETPPPAVALLAAADQSRRDGVRLIQPATADELAAVRGLVAEYGASLAEDDEAAAIDADLAGLPGSYAGPRGALFAITVRGEPAACVAVRPLDGGVAEMKRLYVRDRFRRRGLGDRLTRAAIRAARAAGHRALRLDTLPTMTEARALYRALGFREIPAYLDGRVAGTSFLEIELGPGLP